MPIYKKFVGLCLVLSAVVLTSFWGTGVANAGWLNTINSQYLNSCSTVSLFVRQSCIINQESTSSVTTYSSMSDIPGDDGSLPGIGVTVTGKVVLWPERTTVANVVISASSAGSQNMVTGPDGTFSLTVPLESDGMVRLFASYTEPTSNGILPNRYVVRYGATTLFFAPGEVVKTIIVPLDQRAEVVW